MKEAIKVCVVGHTNTGKTSLLRTLLKSHRFGDIKNQAGTTRHVETIHLLSQGRKVITFADTPGLEDSIAFYETLFSLIDTDQLDRREQFKRVIDHKSLEQPFDQELKVLKALLQSDCIFYVIDTRDSLTENIHKELLLIKAIARPVIPILNFLKVGSTHLEQWRRQLADLSLHTTVEFDTIAFNFEAEKRLYQKMQSVLSAQYDVIQKVIDEHQQRWNQQIETAFLLSAHFLVNLGGYRVSSENAQQALEKLQLTVSQKEQKVIKALFKLFEFDYELLNNKAMDIGQNRWETNLFEPEAFKAFGLSGASNIAKGAAIGAGIDLVVGGLSLGAAAATGATIGAGVSLIQRFHQQWQTKLKGQAHYRIDFQTFSLAFIRQRYLIQTLTQHGHALQKTINLEKHQLKNNSHDTLKALHKTLQAQPKLCEWTELSESVLREKLIQKMQSLLQEPLVKPSKIQ